jgi:hypothetical protein
MLGANRGDFGANVVSVSGSNQALKAVGLWLSRNPTENVPEAVSVWLQYRASCLAASRTFTGHDSWYVAEAKVRSQEHRRRFVKNARPVGFPRTKDELRVRMSRQIRSIRIVRPRTLK